MKKWNLKGNKEIYKMCSHYGNVKSIRGKHLLWLDEYENMTPKDIALYLENCKRKKYERKTITDKPSYLTIEV